MFSTLENVKILNEEEVVTGWKYEGSMLSPLDKRAGVTCYSKREDNLELLKIFFMLRKSEHDQFIIVDELGAFQFENYLHLKVFANDLPNMSAIEYMIMVRENTKYEE